MPPQPCILVIEDDAAIRRGIVDALRFANYSVVECGDGADAMDHAIECSPDLILLDVLLPHRDGFAILDDLRRHDPALAIIMVTARGAEPDRIRGLRGGADDYIVKPFSAKELLARVEAVLRRSPGRPAADIERIHLDGRTIDLARREVRFGSAGADPLSQREAALLRHLALHRDRAVDRDELLHHVWGLNPKGISTRTVDMHIARLRDKLREGESRQPLILTVRAKGYMLSTEARIDAHAEPEGAR